MRQALKDVALALLRQAREDRDGVVGFELVDAGRHEIRRQRLENLVADRFIELGQRLELELRPRQLDELDPQRRIERRDEIADVSLVPFADQVLEGIRIAGLRGRRRALDELGADRPVFVANAG